MTSAAEPNAQEDIRQLLKKISAAWVNGHSEELAAYFHDNMVIVHPRFQEYTTGKQACIASYQDFTQRAVIHQYNESVYTINVWGHTALAMYQFEIAYAMDAAHYREYGRDLFLFTCEQGVWYAVWRTVMPLLG